MPLRALLFYQALKYLIRQILLPKHFYYYLEHRGFGPRNQAQPFANFKRPLSGFSSPVIILNKVVLPAPFGPITPTIPPFGSLK